MNDDDLAFLLFIATYAAQHGYSPTYREISHARGIPLSTVTDRINALVEAKVLRHDHGCRRALTVVPRGPVPYLLAAK